MIIRKFKKCTKCREQKPADAFYPRIRKSGSMALSCACMECERARGRARTLTIEMLAKQNVRQKEYQAKARKEAIRHYSGGTNACSCCGESRYEFLVLDHVHGGGNKHRKESGVSYLATWLTSRGLPPGFQVLCHNCNFAKSAHGKCPHALDKESYAGAEVSGFRDIGANVSLGIGTTVWAFAVIERDVKIGMNCTIGSHCFIGAGTVIGDNCRLQTGVFLPRNTVIEDNVFCGPGVILTDDKYPRAGVPYLPMPPKICAGASIGAGAVILPGVIINSGSMIAAGAVVTHDVELGDLVMGVPGRSINHEIH